MPDAMPDAMHVRTNERTNETVLVIKGREAAHDHKHCSPNLARSELQLSYARAKKQAGE